MARYALRNSSSPGRVALATLDAWGAPAPEGNAQQLADYEGLVSLPFDGLGDPGWNLQVGLGYMARLAVAAVVFGTDAGGVRWGRAIPWQVQAIVSAGGCR